MTWLLIVVLVVGGAVIYLVSQPTPNRLLKYSGRVPDVPCASGQSPEMSPFCLVTEPPLLRSKIPDTNVPPSTAPPSVP